MSKTSFLTLCVNYSNDQETADFVRALVALPDYAGRIIVVSNTDEQPDNRLTALRALKGVDVLFPGRNLGYFGGAAFGLAAHNSFSPFAEWTIVSNTDIAFPDLEFFRKVRSLYEERSPAVIAPNILVKTRGLLPTSSQNQNPHMIKRPSIERMRILHFITGHYTLYSIFEFASSLRYIFYNFFNKLAGKTSSGKQCFPFRIYAPFGAFILIHRSYFEAGGNLDYDSFLYGEEIFVAEMARRLGLEVIFDPRLSIIHREHSAVFKVPSRTIARYTNESLKYLIETYFV